MYIHLFVLLEFFFLHVYTTNERQAGTKEEKRELSLFQLYMDAFTSPGWGSPAVPPSIIHPRSGRNRSPAGPREGGGVKDLPLTKRKLVLQASIG